MISIALNLLSLAMSLLLAAQGAGISDAQKAQAVSTANAAIQMATAVINGQVFAAAPEATSTPPAAVPATATSTTAATSTPVAPSITVSQNPNSSYLSGNIASINQDIGDYIFSASSAEGISISTTTVSVAANVKNVRLYVNRTLWSDQPAVSGGNYTFSSANPFSVVPGGNVRVDVVADTYASTTGLSAATTLAGCAGQGTISGTAVACNTLAGQGLTMGTPSLTAMLNTAAGTGLNVKVGTAGQTLGSFLLAASAAEPLRLAYLTLNVNLSAGNALMNLLVKINQTQAGPILSSIAGGGSYQIGTSAVIAPVTSSTVVDVYADTNLGVQAMSSAVSIAGCYGFGTVSGTAFSCANSVDGQNIVIAQ